MGYTPQFLLPSQINDESGGKQFGPDGKPLTSSKGAVGIAQVMPGTGPEAAQLAGVAWDPNKYASDRDYNLQIGDAYQGHLNKIFNGHQLAATAAYNAGPGKVLRLRQQYGDNWASYLPTETKQYVKKVLGVDVDGGTQQSGAATTVDQIGKNLGIPLANYSVPNPTKGEQAQLDNPQGSISGGFTVPDTAPIADAATHANDSSKLYTDFLNRAIEPVTQTLGQETQDYKTIASAKQGIANDFQTRETNLETSIQPLMSRKQELTNQIAAVGNMPLLEQRIKATFNPAKYDPRILRGRLAAVEDQIGSYEKNYSDLNTLRGNVAAVSVDATNADLAWLDSKRANTMATASLLGQVAGATKEQVATAMLPFQAAVETMGLTERLHASALGKLSLEQTHELYQQAQNSPDGTTTVDGIKFTAGELQAADQRNQGQDISLRSMVNAYKTNDLMTAQHEEDFAIGHMSLEQISDALAHGGQYRGVKLDVGKLGQALATQQATRQQQVSQVLEGTADGQVHAAFSQQQQLMAATDQRAQEMFGNQPGDWKAFTQQIVSFATSWKQGYDAANAKGVGATYMAQTLPQVQSMRKQYDTVVDGLAKKWGGGNTALSDLANAYMRGDPLNGDAAIKGLIELSKSGMPAGSHLSGPAQAAFLAAQSIVSEANKPQAGDSLDFLRNGNMSQAEKDRELQDRVRARVGSVYAENLTDSLFRGLPDLARQIRDPENQSKMHPFSRVSRDDFQAALAYGDQQGYQVVSTKMGVAPEIVKQIFSEGVNGAAWQNVAKQKGYTNDQWATFYSALQSNQMSQTLAALDASHSSHPGFSAAKAFVDFLQNPDVQQRLDKAVSAYGQSNIGSYLLNAVSGSQYRESLQQYSNAMRNQYFYNNGRQMQNQVEALNKFNGQDPWAKVHAINMASGLSSPDSQYLISHLKPIANVNPVSEAELLGGRNPAMSESILNTNANAIQDAIRNHKLQDPKAEALRKRVAANWEEMDAVVGNVFKSVSDK